MPATNDQQQTHQQQQSRNPFDENFDQYKQVTDEITAATRRVGEAYLSGYEQVVERTLGFEREFARNTKQDWLRGLIEAHIDVSRNVAEAQLNVARAVLA